MLSSPTWLPRCPGTVVASLALAAGGIVGCGSGEDGTGSSDGGEPVVAEGDTTVVIAGYAFDPDDLEVPIGAEVTFANTDNVTHTATAQDPDAFDAGEVDAREVDAREVDGGTSAGVRFDEAGRYAYYCAIHPTMTGEVTVR